MVLRSRRALEIPYEVVSHPYDKWSVFEELARKKGRRCLFLTVNLAR